MTNLKYELDQVIEDKIESIGDFAPEGTKAWVDNGILRIDVDEPLPRNATYTGSMRSVWLTKLYKALLDIDISFGRALCIIIVYSPRDVMWDVDNRAYKVVVDALRIAGKVNDDNYQNISILVIGNVDKERPRTEIHVVEQPFTEQEFVSKIVAILKRS
ncbi:MAG: hypothetical protein K6T65_10245 [Peptococcaceae bacterium]|nr:hypothetical protein [Peptococcaceae bacterium]